MYEFLIVVSVIANIFLWQKNAELIKWSQKDSDILTRYIEACRWTSSMRAAPYDIDCYAHRQVNKNMEEWSNLSGKDPLIIENFRDYLNFRNKHEH